MMSPAMGILQIAGLDINFYKWATIGPQYLEIQRNMSIPMTVVSGWENQVRLMKCL
jgi:hypothetical protein